MSFPLSSLHAGLLFLAHPWCPPLPRLTHGTQPHLLVQIIQGHCCPGVLLSGFQAGLGIRQRVDAVEKALASATLLFDMSHWGIIRVQGEDRLRFLHSQGTNAFEDATEGG